METEIDIPVSVSSKKGDREDDALSSEFLEGKVTEHPGNKVKQLESGTNQSLETSSHVVETVNTQLETDKPTAEGGNFFQALSVPMVTADEHSNTPESCEATTTEDQEERKKSKIEAFTEGKPNDDERVEVIASKEASANELQPKTEDHDIVEAISAQNEGSIVHALGLVKGSDKDIEGVTEFCNKDERMSGSSEAKAEAGKEEDLQGKNYSEGKEPESVKTKENIEEDTEEIRPSVETEEKTECEGLRDGIATDVCVSTQTKPEEGTTEDEEKKDEKAIESDNGQMKKLGRPLVKEACEETGLEKGESEEGLELSDSMAPSKKELASNDEDQEKEQVLNIFGKDQDDGDDFTGSQYATCDDIKETTGQQATTVDYFKEQDLNETHGEILKEETEDKSVDAKEGSEQRENGARDEREQKPMESINEIVNSCSEIEQEEQIEEIRPSVEIEEEMEQKGLLHAITTDTCISTQTKSQVEAPEHEEKDEEEATESDDGQKEKSDNPSMKEVCEETAPKKVESEKEKAISVLHKDEDQEKEQEVNMSEKDQGEDNITSSQNATFEGGLQKKNQHSESNEPELVIEEDTEEIRSGVKTLEKTEQQRLIHAIPTAVCISTQTEPEGTTENKEKNDEEAIGSDDGQTKKPGSPTVKKVCEEVVPEKAESEEVLKHSDNSSMALNENEIASKDEDQEKEQELYVSGKGQGGGVDVTSSQNASSEDIQETTTGQHATTLAYFEEVQDLNAMPKYILKEEAEDKTINPQEASEQGENEAKDKKEQKTEESVNKIVHSCSEIEQEEDTEEIKPSVETKEKSEQQELLHAITTDACISTQTNSHVESAEHEENKEETIESDDGQKEKSDNLSVREICEEMGSEKVESEGVKLSDNFSMKQNEKTIARLNKGEDQETEHELSMSEKDQGEDDVTYSQDSASVEDLQEKNYNDEGRGPKFVTTRESIEEVTEETISTMERKENVEQQGLLHAITTDASISTQTESQVGTKEHEEKNGEEVIESDEGQKENSESSLVKDVCEDTASEKVEYDEVKHSNSSSMKLDEKAITRKDEDQESEQKVNMSEKDQVEDDFTSLHDTTFEGGLQEKKHHSEGNEPEVVKTKESLAEGTEEIIYSVESKEKTEEQRLMHAITTDVCLSAQTEPEEETTKENEEKIEEDAIESDDGQTNKPGSPVVKEVCDETVSEKADESEEGLKHSDSSSMKLNENELASKDEYREKEQELDMLEKDQDGGDDVTSSQNASNEDIKEMIDQHATKVAYFDEVQGLNALPKDILKEEAKDRTTDPQEASEEYENGANDKRGQKAEEIIHSCSEIEQEEYAEEIKPSAEIEGKKEEQGLMHAIITDAWISTQTKSQEESQLETTENEEKKEEVTESDDGQKEKFNNPSIKEVREETDAEKVESEGVELYHNSGMKLNEKAIAILRKDEDLEKEQELNMSEQDQHKDGVTCSQGATSVKDLQGKEPEFVKTRESMEEDIEENKSSVERKEKVEQQGLLHAITTDVCISTQTGSQEENTKNAEEAIESADGRKEKSDNDSGKEVCEEAGIEKAEFEEGMKHSDSSNMKLNEKAIAILSKDEDQKKEQAFNMPEEYQGEDEVTCSWDTSSKEDLEGKYYDGEHNEPKLDETRESIKEDIEVIRTNVETEERKEQQGSLHAITTDVCMSARTEPQEETTKAEEENEAIERYDGQKEKPAIPSVKEVCEETSLDNSESKEGVKLFDSSRRKLNEKAIATFKDEDQEKDQEVNMSAKGSQDAASKEDLQEKNYHKEDNESEVVKTRQSIEEDIEKIKSNVETKGNSEHQGLLHVITTDVCSSTQTEPKKEAAENEEKNDEEAIHNDDGRTKKSENPLVKEVCEATGLQKADFEEGVKHFDSSSTTLNENDLSSKDKDQEKEQELKMSEVQCGGDDVISSQNTESEDIKETTIQHATTIADFKEQGLNERPKGILKEETEDKSVDAQEASKQCENGATDRREQETEDSVNKPVHSHSEIIGENIKEDDADAGNNKEEVSFEKLKYEAGESGDGTECETAGVTQKISPENKDDATADESKSTEEILHDVEMSYDKAGSPLAEEIEDEKFNKKEDWNMDSETHMQKGDVTKKVDEEHFYATYEQKSIDASEQEKSIPGELQARVEKELQEDTRSHQLKDYGSENPCTTTQDIFEEVGEKTTMKPEKITKQDFQESQSKTDKEIEAKLDAENQADRTEDRSEMKDDVVLTEKMSFELGQPMEHNVEEIQACRTKTMSEKTEDEIQTKEKDVSHGSIEDTNDDITKEEKCFLDGRTREIEISTLEHETVEEQNGGLDEESKEKYTDPNETTSVEPQEDSMPSSSLGISTDGSSNSEKSKAESENLTIDLESVSEVQIPGVVPNSEDSNLKEECLISETATYVDEETGTVTKEISSDEISYSDPIPVGNPEVTKVRVDAQIGQEDLQAAEDISCESKASSTTQAFKMDMKEGPEKSVGISGEVKNASVDEAPKQERLPALEDAATFANLLGISEKSKAESENLQIEDLESVSEVQIPRVVPNSEDSNLKEECLISETATDVDEETGTVMKEISSDEISYSDPIPVGNPEVTKVRVDAQIGQEDLQAAEDISCESRASSTTQAFKMDMKEGPEKSVGISGEVKNASVDEAPKQERLPALEDAATFANLLGISEKSKGESENLPIEDRESVSEVQIPRVVPNSEGSNLKEECLISETATDVDEETGTVTKEISSDEISYSDPIPVGNPEVAKVRVDAQIGQEDLQAAEDINCESRASSTIQALKMDMKEGPEKSVGISGEVKNASVDEAPKQERLPALEDAATFANLLGISEKSKAESENLSIEDLESVSEVQIPGVVPNSEHSNLKEECLISETATYVDEETGTVTKEISSDEISYSDPIPVGNPEVTKVRVDAQIGQEDLQAAEDISCESRASSTIQALKMDMKEGPEKSVGISGEVKNASVDEAPKQERLPALEDVATFANLHGISEKSKAESENLPIEDLEYVSEVQIPGVVPNSEDSNLKEECLISKTAMYVDEERGTVTKEISSDEISYSDPIPVGNPEVTKVRVDAQIGQEDLQAAEDISCESRESSIQALKMDMKEGPEKSVGISGEVKNAIVDEAPKQERLPALEDAATFANLLGISEKSKAESENLPIEDLESVSEVQIPGVVPNSEHSNLKEECLISETVTYVDEETGTVTKEISSDEISYSDLIPVGNPEVTKVRVDAQTGQEDLQAAEDISCESRASSTIQALKMDMKEGPEKSVGISGEVKNASVDEAPKQERLPALEDAATLEPQVNLPYLESTYPSESEKSPMQALESVYEVQTPEVVAYSKDSKVKEECIDLATAKYTDENNVEEEQKIKINELSSAEKKEQAMESKQVAEHPSISYLGAVLIEEELGRSSEHENTTDEGRSVTDPYQDSVADKTIGESCPPATEVENVKQASTKSDEAKRSDPNTEEKALTKENLELHGEVKPTSELMIEEYQVNEAKPQPEQLDITSENISKCQTLESKLEHRSEKDLVDGRRDMEHDVTLAPEFHIYSTENQNETMKNLILTDKLLDEIKENDAKEDIEVIVRQEEKAIEDSYQDAVAEVTVHERLSQTEEVKARIEKLVSMVPPEELTSPRAKGQTYELVLETDKTKVEHSCISKEDRIPELTEKKVTNKISEDQRSIKERYIEEEGQDNFGVENKEARSVNVVVDDVIVNEVLLEVEKSKESKSLNDNINEEDSCVHNQLTSATDELCQIKKLNSSPNELLEAKGSVEDTEDPKLMAENLNLKAENFTVMKEPYEDKKQNVEKTSEIVASEFERLENMVTEGKKIEADANKERETLEEPQADDPAKTISESTSSTEQDKEVRSEESSGQGDVHKLEEKPTEVFEITSEVVEIVAEGREASAILTENVQEASSKMFLVKHDPEITTNIEKIEDEIKDKDETLVNVHLFTSTKEVACPSNEKTEEIQISTLNSEIDEGKQNGLGDMLNKEREAVQPQEHISNIKFVDPPSDVEIREQRELMHCGLQEPSEDNALLSHNDKKIADSFILPSVEKEIIQGVDKRFEEAPAIDFQKHEKGLDNTTKARIVDVVSNAECSEIEQQHLDTKEATLESINQEYQSEQKKVDESIESEIPIQKVSEQTIAHKEIANEFLVMSVAKEEEKRNNLQDRSKEQEYSGESMHQDLEAVKKPFQTKKLSEKVNKAGPIDIQEETMAEGNLHKEETEERTNITAATVNLHHREKSDETKCKGTSTEAAIPVEYVKISDVELECDMDAPVPKCASTRNPEVRSADLEGPSVMDATADKAGYNKDPSDKTTEVHVAEKGVLKEDVHLESTCDKSKTTEKVSGMNQEPFNLPLTTERSMELDAPVMHGTAATEDVQISQKCVTDDPIKISQIQPEKETYKISACTEDKQLPNKPHQNESMESKLLPGNINASHEEGEATAKSLNAEAEDLKATNASGTKPQCSSEVVKEGKKISDEKEKSETPEPATILFTDILHESTQGNSEVAENLIEEREPALTKDQQVDKEETGDRGAKTNGENEEEEDDEDNQKMGSCSDALVMVEASKDMEVKVHKKSHNILSGVGSKVKHSIAKVKKAITGKSSHPKPPSPKGRD